MSTPFYDLASLVVVPSGYKASKVYAQKPQTTDGQLAFTRSTTATRVNSAGLIEASAINVPRLDYLGSTCPKLLLEPSRTNLALHSSAFDNAAWSKYQATITANVATSPDGSANADKFLDTTANDGHNLYGGYTISGDTTFSIFVKSAEYTRFSTENLSDGGSVIFNLSTGTVVSTSANYKNPKIENYGNGWYRVSATTNGVSGAKAIGWSLVNSSGNIVFTGTGTSGVLVYGAQVELGAYATSYIPTTTAAVTRGADTSVKTGISSLIGQTEGVIYVEAIHNAIGDTSGADNVAFSIEGSTFNDLVGILYQPNGDIIVVVFVASALHVIITYNAGVTSTPQKIAVAYKNNDFALYVNGVLRGSDTSGTVPTCSNLGLGNYYNGGAPAAVNAKSIKQALLFKTRLTNAQLAELTTI